MSLFLRAIPPRSRRSAPGFLPLTALTLAAAFAVSPAAGTEPVIDENRIFLATPSDSFPHKDIQALLDEGKEREALTAVHARLKKGGLTRAGRAGLLTLAARLEAQLGNHERAIREAEKAIGTGGLSNTEKAESYLFLSRLYLAKKPPDFRKAAEYQRRYNAITGD